MTLPQILLALTLLILAVFVPLDAREYARFKRLEESAARRRVFAKWVVQTLLMFGGGGLAGLALLGRLDGIVAFPPEFLPAVFFGDGSEGMPGIVTGIAFGMIGGAVLMSTLTALRGGKGADTMRTIGDINALIPRNRAELPHGALLSISAGVTEELFFRLYLPLLIVLAGGGAILAFILSAAVFGFMHVYQGVAGVIGTTLVGLLFAAVYVVSGSLWLPILLHVLLDLNGLVFAPALMLRGRALSS